MLCSTLEVIVAFDINCWRDTRVYWLKRRPISAYVEARVQTLAECNRHLWCISIQGSDWIRPPVQCAEMILLLLDPRLAVVVEKGEGSRGCDGGIMEFLTGQRQTIDPSAGSLCFPLIRHGTHRSSAVHQAGVFLEEEWSSATAAAAAATLSGLPRLCVHSRCFLFPVH